MVNRVCFFIALLSFAVIFLISAARGNGLLFSLEKGTLAYLFSGAVSWVMGLYLYTSGALSVRKAGVSGDVKSAEALPENELDTGAYTKDDIEKVAQAISNSLKKEKDKGNG